LYGPTTNYTESSWKNALKLEEIKKNPPFMSKIVIVLLYCYAFYWKDFPKDFIKVNKNKNTKQKSKKMSNMCKP
jgi:hypothetical protein